MKTLMKPKRVKPDISNVYLTKWPLNMQLNISKQKEYKTISTDSRLIKDLHYINSCKTKILT